MRHLALAPAALALVVVTACGSSQTPTVTPGSQASSPPVASPSASTAEPSPSASPTMSATPTPTAMDGVGEWCAALTGAAAEVKTILSEFEGEWRGPVTSKPEPRASDTYEEALQCVMSTGDNPLTAPVLRVSEQRFADESGASLAQFRDDSDPSAVTIEDFGAGDEAVYLTILVANPATPAVLFSVVVRDGDRRTIISLREPGPLPAGTPAPPANEAERRDQVTRVVELLDERR